MRSHVFADNLTTNIVNVTGGLEKDYEALVEGVVRRINEMGLQIRTIFADRMHFNLAVIAKFCKLGVDFIMAAKADKRITKLLKRHKEEQGHEAAIFTYHFLDERSPDFYLVMIPTREYDPQKHAGAGALFLDVAEALLGDGN